MRLYLTTSENKDGAIKGHWAGTQADARADRKKMKDMNYSFIETAEVEVPTNKAELLKFLNDSGVKFDEVLDAERP